MCPRGVFGTRIWRVLERPIACIAASMADRTELLEHHLLSNPGVLYVRSGASPLAVIAIDEDVLDALGYPAARLLETPELWLSFLHPDDLERVRQDVGQHAQQADVEFRIRHADGAYRVVRDQSRPITRADGSVEILGTWTDVTEARAATTTINALHARLGRATRELEQFAYVASHDLRAPLRAVDALSAWLEADLAAVLTGEAKEQMALLRGRVRRMDRLLVDLLEYSRVGSSRAPADLVDVGALLEEIIDLSDLRPRLQLVPTAPLPAFVTARAPLKRVLTNLMSNAVKHSDRPTSVVTVHCDLRGDFYQFDITDDGPGIPEQFHDRVFQIFQTLKPRDTLEGSGMGLALARRIVESRGGKLQLTSTGRGATFSFSWPAVWIDVAPTGRPPLVVEPARTERARLPVDPALTANRKGSTADVDSGVSRSSLTPHQQGGILVSGRRQP